MDTEKFIEMVYSWRERMVKDGFDVRPVRRVSFINSVRAYGKCKTYLSEDACELQFARFLLALIDEDGGKDVVDSTILHELCHAVRGTNHHDYVWKICANKVYRLYGVTVTRVATKTEASIVESHLKSHGGYRYHITCSCGAVDLYRSRVGRYRNPMYFCRKCRGRLIIEDCAG